MSPKPNKKLEASDSALASTGFSFEFGNEHYAQRFMETVTQVEIPDLRFFRKGNVVMLHAPGIKPFAELANYIRTLIEEGEFSFGYRLNEDGLEAFTSFLKVRECVGECVFNKSHPIFRVFSQLDGSPEDHPSKHAELIIDEGLVEDNINPAMNPPLLDFLEPLSNIPSNLFDPLLIPPGSKPTPGGVKQAILANLREHYNSFTGDTVNGYCLVVTVDRDNSFSFIPIDHVIGIYPLGEILEDIAAHSSQPEQHVIGDLHSMITVGEILAMPEPDSGEEPYFIVLRDSLGNRVLYPLEAGFGYSAFIFESKLLV